VSWLARFVRRIVPARYRLAGTGAYFRVSREVCRLTDREGRVECPCCAGRFDRFRPFGPNRRPNAQCPGCGALERHRLIWLYLRDHTDLLQKPARVLHVAPEPVLRRHLAAVPGIDYVCGDREAGVGDHRLDVTRLPFEDESFDVILCNHVLEHVPDDHRAMGELYRVLRTGGWAVLQTPLDGKRSETFEDPAVTTPEQRERVYGQHDHVRIYGLDLYDRLRGAGFVLELNYAARDLPPEEVARYGVPANQPVMVCRKAPPNAPAPYGSSPYP
jgi:SAM-dependent methyltransferase